MEIYTMHAFSHAYCDMCQQIREVATLGSRGEDRSSQFNLDYLVCAVCRATLLAVCVPKGNSRPLNQDRLTPRESLRIYTVPEPFTRAYCEQCEQVREFDEGELHGHGTTYKFMGRDIVCAVCGWIIIALM